MMGLGFYNATNTTLDLNGPFLRYTTQPSLSGEVSHGGTLILSGISTGTNLNTIQQFLEKGNKYRNYYINGILMVLLLLMVHLMNKQLVVLKLLNLQLQISSIQSIMERLHSFVSHRMSHLYQSSTPVTVEQQDQQEMSKCTPDIKYCDSQCYSSSVNYITPVENTGIEDSFSILNNNGTTTDPDLNSQIISMENRWSSID